MMLRLWGADSGIIKNFFINFVVTGLCVSFHIILCKSRENLFLFKSFCLCVKSVLVKIIKAFHIRSVCVCAHTHWTVSAELPELTNGSLFEHHYFWKMIIIIFLTNFVKTYLDCYFWYKCCITTMKMFIRK